MLLASATVATQSGDGPGRRPPRAPDARTDAPSRKYVEGELLVRFKNGTAATRRADAHRQRRGVRRRGFNTVRQLDLVGLPAGMTVAEAMAQYREDPDVAYVEPNYLMQTTDVPQDPHFGLLWGLHNTGQSGGTVDADIDATDAWDITTGGADVVIAIIDTGVDYTHPDLADNMFRNADECDADGVDDDANGYVDDCYGIDAVNGDGDPRDDNNHGTHVAGTIGALGDNGIGVVGVSRSVKMMACKMFPAWGGGSIADAIECLDYVRSMKERGVNIVASSNSWGGGGFSQALLDAIETQRQHGILFIAAAGNNSSDNDRYAFYPAGYYLPNVISVAATTRTDGLASFSNAGRRSVHVGAPGLDILSTLPNSLYGSYSGTSMATPHVSGLAALIKAQDPTRDWRAIRNLILTSVDAKPALSSTVTGGRINAHNALTCSTATVTSRLRPIGSTVAVTMGEPVTLAAVNVQCDEPAGEITVSIAPGNGSVTLLDDGSAPDQAAGDGIYTAQWTPAEQQPYTLTFPGGDIVSVPAPLSGYSPVQTSYSYRTITGTSLALTDDASATITPPFPILYGGSPFTSLHVSSNGTISVTRPYTSFSNSGLPVAGLDTLIAPFWDDLYPSGARNVYWAVTGSAPNRELVVEWRDVAHFSCSSGHGATFQAVFFEGSSDLVFNYADVTFVGGCGFADGGRSATVGTQVAPATALQFSHQTASLSAGLGILWRVDRPNVTVTPFAQDYANVAVGRFSDQTYTVYNDSGSTISGSASVAAPFSVIGGSPFSIPRGESRPITVRFTPTQAGSFSQTIAFATSAGNTTAVAMGGGVMAPPVLSIRQSYLDFGSLNVGTTLEASFTVENTGGGTLIGSVSSPTAPFSIVSGATFSLTAGATHNVVIRFAPPTVQYYYSSLTFTSNVGSQYRYLYGQGITPPLLSVTPASHDFGTVGLGDVGVRVFNIRNSGGTPLVGTATVSMQPGNGTGTASAPLGVQSGRALDAEPGELLVKFRGDADEAKQAAANQDLGVQVLRRFETVGGLQLVRAPSTLTVDQAVAAYRSRPEVEYAEPNYRLYTQLVPNDPEFGSLWSLHNTGQSAGTADADIDAPEAWDITTGSSLVVVAVIDTGIDYTHPDLAANIFRNDADCDGDGVDDDGNGFADDCHGIDVVNGDSNPMDDHDHGTHVAGTIGAVGGNGTGVAGVAWNVRLLPCKFLSAWGYGSTAGAIACLDYVAALRQRGVNVVATNNSWGGGGFSQALIDAIDAQRARDILFVAAAGNYGENNDVMVEYNYPATYNRPNMIAVAATTRTDALASFSNYGRRSVHVGAPGLDILSTLPGGLYGSFSGTSMAAPHVTGLVALLKAQDPTRDWRALRNLILTSGDATPALANTVAGRRINAHRALTCSGATLTSRVAPFSSAVFPTSGTAITLAAVHVACGSPAGEVSVTVNGEQTLTLRDDGIGVDLAAGDGVYSLAWTPAASGVHRLMFPGNDEVTISLLSPYSVSPIEYSYRSIAGTGLNLADDGSATVTAPFPLRFGGGSYTAVSVNANGVLTFDTFPSSMSGNWSLPHSSARTLVAPYWDNLLPYGPTQNVFWQVLGSAPNRELVVEWRNVGSRYCSSSPAETVRFQVVFFEANANVLFNYADTAFRGASCSYDDNGRGATVGMQVGPTSATQVGYYSPVLSDGLALLWTLSGPFSVVSGGPFTIYPGESRNVLVRFSPTTNGTFSGLFGVVSNAGSVSRPVTGTAVAAAPMISSLSPASVSVGEPSFLLTVNGSQLLPTSQVQINGAVRPTTYASPTQLTAEIPDGDLLSVGTLTVTVTTPSPGGGTSNALPLAVTVATARPIVSLTSPTTGTTVVRPADVGLAAAAGDSDGAVTQVAFYANGVLVGTDTTSPYAVTWPAPPAGDYALTAVATDNSGATGTSAAVTLHVVWDPNRMNLAAAALGATAAVSSQFSFAYGPSGAINGDRRGNNWGSNGGWNDAARHQYPDWLQVNFAREATIDEVDVFGVQDGYLAPLEPTELMTSTLYTLRDFHVEFLSGNTWLPIPGASWTGNDRVWRRLTFAPVTARSIRLVVGRTADGFTRVAEFEAWGTYTPSPVPSISSISPTTLMQGAWPGVLTVHGSSFEPNSVVRVNGLVRPTTYVSPTQLTAQLDYTDTQTGGNKTVMVVTPAPGGGNSNSVSLFVNARPTVAITSPTAGQSFYGPATVEIAATAADADGTVAQVRFYGDGVLLGTDTSAPFAMTWSPVLARSWSHSVYVEAVDNSGNMQSASTYFYVTIDPSRVNVAAAARGAVASASSQYSATYAPARAIDGEHRGQNWGSGGGWVEAGPPNSFPDWLQVNFAGARTIHELTLFSVQDNVSAPVEPDEWTSFFRYGVRDFTAEYWDGSQWRSLGAMTWNSYVIARLTFAPVTTDRVRVHVTRTSDGWTRVVELQAWGTATNPVPAVSALAPSTVIAGSSPPEIVVDGANFVPESVVRVNGGSRNTAFVSPTRLRAQLIAGDVASATTHAVTVFTPAPGGGASTAATLTVLAPNALPTVSLTSPANGMSFVAGTPIALTAAAADSDGSIALVEFRAGAQLLSSDTSSPYSFTWTNAPIGTHQLTATAVDNNGGTSASSAVTIRVTEDTSRVNVAASSRGAVASASSQYSASYGPAGAINGDRRGLNWGAGGGWNDASSTSPDWFMVTFAAAATIDRIDLYGVQEQFGSPVEPTDGMLTRYALRNYRVEYDSGGTWTLLWTWGGNVHVWNRLEFPAITTSRIRILIDGTLDGFSRLAEIEAWGAFAPPNAPPLVSITDPVEGESFSSGTSVTAVATATDGDGTVAQVRFYDGSTLLGTDTTAPFSWTWSPATGSHVITAVATDNGGAATTSAARTFVVEPPAGRLNVAAAANGATAAASSAYSVPFGPAGTINGDRRGLNWGNGGGWNDATRHTFPDWLEVTFAGPRTIDEVVVIGVQDAWASPVEPSDTMTASLYPLQSFSLQYWNGSAWLDLGAAVAGNTLVRRHVTFAAVTTSRIRLLVSQTPDGYTRVAELEAWGVLPGTPPTATLTSPTTSTVTAPAAIELAATAADSDGTVAQVAFYANGNLLGVDTTSPYAWTMANVGAGTYTLTAVATDNAGQTGTSAAVVVTVQSAGGGARINVAAAANGATAAVSSQYSTTFGGDGAINGDRRGLNWGTNGGWNDATRHSYPDILTIVFAGTRTIDEVDVFSVQNAYAAPAEPTESMTFTQYGVQAFSVDYWNEVTWVTVANGTVTGNNQVWRRITFPAVTTDRIRIVVTQTPDGYTRLAEVEAWGTAD